MLKVTKKIEKNWFENSEAASQLPKDSKFGKLFIQSLAVKSVNTIYDPSQASCAQLPTKIKTKTSFDSHHIQVYILKSLPMLIPTKGSGNYNDDVLTLQSTLRELEKKIQV